MLIEEQAQHPGQLIGRIAEDMGLVTDDQLIQALGEQFGLQTIDIEGFSPPDDARTQITNAMAQLYRVIPLQLSDGILTLATCDPHNLSMQDEIRRFVGHDIRMLVATENQILKAIDKFFNEETESIESIIKELQEDADLAKAAQKLASDGPINLGDVSELVESAPVRKLLNMVLLLAIKDHASDIHFEPFEDEFRIRIKSDGVLYEMVPPPRHLAFAITTRVKVMANLDIAERRLAPGRADRTDRGRSPDRPAGQRVADHVWGKRGDAGAGPQRRIAGPEQRGHERGHDCGFSRGDAETQRDYSGDRAHRFGQDHDAVFAPCRN